MTEHQWLTSTDPADTALVEADKWYREHVEKS